MIDLRAVLRSTPATLEWLERRRLLSLETSGLDLRVNEYTPGDQRAPAVAVHHGGDFVVVWASEGQDGSESGIYGRRFDASGTPRGGEFRANTYTTGIQFAPSVAVDGDGDFVVVWESRYQDGSGLGVYAQRYNASGEPQGDEFRVNTYVSESQRHATVAMEPDGDFVVVWASYQQEGAAGYGLYAQRYDAGGSKRGGEFRVNQHTTGSHVYPHVAVDAAGGFVVAWSPTLPSSTEYDVLARRFAADGSPVGEEFLVNAHTTSVQANPSVAVAADGRFAVAWNSYMQDGDDYGVYARRFATDGTPDGGEMRVNTSTSDDQSLPSIAFASNGDALVAWQGNGQDGSGYGTFARRFDRAGAPAGGEFRVNAHTTANQVAPAVARTAAGDAVVVWQGLHQDGSLNGVFARRYRVRPNVTASSFAYRTVPHRVGFTFDEPVAASLGPDDVTVLNLTTSQTIPPTDFALAYDPATETATLTYVGAAGALPDGNYRATLHAAGVHAPNGNPLPADHVLEFRFLTGDANNDGTVNLSDFNLLAANFGQSGRDYTQGDFNYDGTVNLADFNLLAARFGASLAPDGAAVPGRGGAPLPPLSRSLGGSLFSGDRGISGGDEDDLLI